MPAPATPLVGANAGDQSKEDAAPEPGAMVAAAESEDAARGPEAMALSGAAVPGPAPPHADEVVEAE
eukprot:5444851-Lingulodinium_polyedra.AAC.1